MHVAGETLSFKKTGSLARFFLGSRIKSANFFHHGTDRKRFRFWGHMIPVSSTRLCGRSGQREDRDKGTGRSVKQGVPTPVPLTFGLTVLLRDCGSLCGISESDREMPSASSAPLVTTHNVSRPCQMFPGDKITPMEPLP